MRKFRGIALIPVLIATSIVGIAVPATVALVTACTTSNGETARLTQAISLANNVLEFGSILKLTDPNERFGRSVGEVPPACDNLFDLNGWTFSPPIDSGGRSLSSMNDWQQDCTVTAFHPLVAGVQTPSNTNARLLTVNVRYRGRLLYTGSRVYAPTLGLNP